MSWTLADALDASTDDVVPVPTVTPLAASFPTASTDNVFSSETYCEPEMTPNVSVKMRDEEPVSTWVALIVAVPISCTLAETNAPPDNRSPKLPPRSMLGVASTPSAITMFVASTTMSLFVVWLPRATAEAALDEAVTVESVTASANEV